VRDLLYLSYLSPVPTVSGAQWKTHSLLSELTKRYNVDLVTFVRWPDEEYALRTFDTSCRSVHSVPLVRSRGQDVAAVMRGIARGRPFLIERDRSLPMERCISRLVTNTNYDLVHVDQLNMAQFVPDRLYGRAILDEHNVVWRLTEELARGWGGIRQVLGRVEATRMRRYEAEMCRVFRLITVVSEGDRQQLIQLGAAPGRVAAHPIGFNAAFPARQSQPQDGPVLLLGDQAWPPNADAAFWYAREIHPILASRRPGIRAEIIGRRPSSRLIAMGRRGLIVRGYAPDLESAWRDAGVLAVPLRAGSGMRVKILEAFARGVPVVATAKALEGISAVDGLHCIVADEPELFAAGLEVILNDDELATRLARNARLLVEARYDSRAITARVADSYMDLVA
jgi:polysaccharide biosynthesis protein PslH